MFVYVVKSDEYEALYINGFLKAEGNPLNEGTERLIYFIKIAESYGVDVKDIKFFYSEYLNEYGEFPNRIEEIESIEPIKV